MQATKFTRMKRLLIFVGFLLFGATSFAQVLSLGNIVRPGAPASTISVSPNSFSTFTTNAGIASSSQSTAVTGTLLTNNILVNAPSGYEISSNGSTWVTTTITITQSGGNASGTIYSRLAAADPAATYSGNLSFSSTGAISVNISLSGIVNSGTPTITISPSTLSGFSTTAGIASASQSFLASGSNLFADILVTAPTNYQVSLDNTNWFTTRFLVNTAGTVPSTTVFIRIASSASAGSPSGNVALTSTSATTQNVAVSGTVGAGSSKDSIFINMDTTQLMSVGAGWVNLTGDPSLNILSVSNTSGLLTATTVAKANWVAYSGNCAFPNNGNVAYTMFPSQAVKEVFYSYNAAGANTDPYNSSKPKFRITGCKPGATYKIIMGASQTFGFTSTTEFRVKGSTTLGPVSFDGHNNTSYTTKVTSSGTNTTFDAVSPDGSNNIEIFVNAATGQDMGFVTCIQIWEN